MFCKNLTKYFLIKNNNFNYKNLFLIYMEPIKKDTKKATKKVTKTATKKEKSIEDVKNELEHPKIEISKEIQSAVKQLKPKKVNNKSACQNCGFVKPVIPKTIKERSCTVCDEMYLDKRAHDDENKDKHAKIKSMIAYVKSNIDMLSLEVLQQK